MPETRALHYREGKHDKVYIATLDGCTVKLQWGRRGSSLQHLEKTFSFQGAAYNFWEDKLQEKKLKGYQPGLDPSGDSKPLLPIKPQPVPAPQWNTPKPPEPTKPGLRKFRLED